MKQKAVFTVFSAILFIVAVYGPSFVFGGAFPLKPVEIIVTYSAGGGTDLTMRTFAPFFEKTLGVPVAILNKPGAGGVIGWTAIAKSKPDGYTTGNVNLPAIIGAFVTNRLPVDPRTAYQFLGNIVFDPNCIAVQAKSPYNSLADLIEYLKKNPSGISYGATGKVSTDGLTALAIEKAANIKFRVVNFKGGKDAITAALGGHVDAVGLTVSEALVYVQEGSLKLLGIGGSDRHKDFPNVPTFKEQGFPLKVNGSSRGLQMPAGASDTVLNTLREAVKKAANMPEYRAKAKEVGLQGTYVNYQEVAKTVQEQIEWLKGSLSK